jgi:hypothetical protein
LKQAELPQSRFVLSSFLYSEDGGDMPLRNGLHGVISLKTDRCEIIESCVMRICGWYCHRSSQEVRGNEREGEWNEQEEKKRKKDDNKNDHGEELK